MVRKFVASVCSLNQWSLEFEGNKNRILQSIQYAVQEGAKYRSGPELEICGYTCEDHFLEPDTSLHSWEVLVAIMMAPICRDIVVDVGMPVIYKSRTYNCRVIFYNKKICLIRPKMCLCNSGNYRESRWFTPWSKERTTEQFYLPQFVAQATGQISVPIGDAVLMAKDVTIGYEICEELWNPQSAHIPMALDGVEVIVNGSGSYMELRKANYTIDLVRSATFKAGGCYLYSNLRGGDGGRVYFNGCSCVSFNGDVVARTQQFSLIDVEVATATVDLDLVSSYRTRLSTAATGASASSYPRIILDARLTHNQTAKLSSPISWQYHTPEEEIAYGPACWLWDYLRRSNQGGFFLPLSGGVDSCSSATIVHSMCRLVVQSCPSSEEVLSSVRTMVSDPNYYPHDARELCGRLFFTCYMATENSSAETKSRAKLLAQQIGSTHTEVNVSGAVTALLNIFALVTGMKPKFSTHGGTPRECLALQNVQARVRMVIAYLFSQLVLWARNRQGGLLVLGSANVDESLRGYLTKYDCSSADVNPIGGISKIDLRSFLAFAKDKFDLPALGEIMSAVPTAELMPLNDGCLVQTDEADMGLTYAELSTMGRCRMYERAGPYSMFQSLLPVWKEETPQSVAEKVKHFFRCYALNRHKMTVLTPSVHLESYSPDDNRFDHRPFLYSISWRWQFAAIQKHLQMLSTIENVNCISIKDTSAPIPPVKPRKNVNTDGKGGVVV
ncbi:Glutamine-dependent NAD [Nesidiocoris tenuis]|uniref:Glutamine-dependent NAD(+) synthetase n=1 Tax=Nesidiocoris tenuis TaxID=355587 RepID=A0ABN7B4L7_9HEMI|nr:Glutamine-dependent NAD [Nesidiocoris tenuis]